jgi:3,4-dihydroxy 2-butanone 4-phosphate synthase/GTP cyclohydrolase II
VELALDSIEHAIAAIAKGDTVVVVDDEERENEGDLILAASKATREQIAFMIRHTSGILCVPLPVNEARRLQLDPMVSVNNAPLGTAFTVSVDYREGLTTGISAEERCATVRALANPNVGPGDFVKPGHVFPLVAKEGGVLMRSGHTEAAVDLTRLAGLPPFGVIGELVNDDGSVKRGAQVLDFARQHRLRIVSVAGLIAYRQQREQLVQRVAQFPLVTEAGPARGMVYATPFDAIEHLALVFGDVASHCPVPVRFHREDLINDVFGGGSLLKRVFARFQAEGAGVLVYLRQGAAGVPAEHLRADAAREEEGAAGAESARQRQWRDVGVGAQIQRDLRVSSIRLLATRSRRYVGLAGFGIEIDETELLDR